MIKSPATLVLLLVSILSGCRNNSDVEKYKTTNASYQIDSTRNTSATDTNVAIPKPTRADTTTVLQHIDPITHISTIPPHWETVRLHRRTIDRIGSHVDSLAVLMPADTAAHLQPINGTTSLQTERIEKKSGLLGYSFFKEMKRSETKNIHAFISIRHSESALRDTIRIINAQEEPNTRNDTVSIFTQNILLYRYVDIQLLDPDHSFGIEQIHNSARQEVNDTDGNHWQWAVTPKTDKKNARLILKVVAEKPNEPAEPFESRTIPITIHVNTNIVRQLWIYLYDHPEYVFTAILIPLVAYIGKKIFDRRKAA